MSKFLDWAKMNLSGNFSSLNNDIGNLSSNIYHLFFNQDNKEIYSINEFPTIKDPLKENEVDLKDDELKYAIDVVDEDIWHMRLETNDGAFSWRVDVSEEEYDFVPVGLTPEILLHEEYHIETDRRVSEGRVTDCDGADAEEILAFIIQEVS